MTTRAALRWRRILRGLRPIAWLTLVWVLLQGSLSAATVLFGIGLAIVVTVALPLPRVVSAGAIRPLGLIWFLLRFLYDLVVSSVQVAWWALFPRGLRNAVVAIELGTRSDLLVTITAQTLTLIPGSIVLDVDRQTSTLYAHVLGVRTEQDLMAFRRDVLALESRVVRAFRARRHHPSPAQEGSP